MSQEEFKIRAIKPVHINPSIMEGERLYESILGPDVAVAIDRYVPINLVAPFVSGNPKIPATLTINNGVWDGSPSPQFTYQWTADGVDIPGATGKTFLTYSDLDEKAIGCTVRAFSIMGETIVESSNMIVVGIIEPIILEEQFYFPITGLNQVAQQNLMGYRLYVSTGLWVDSRFDMVTKVDFGLSGLWVDSRSDTMGLSGFAISGLGLDQLQATYYTEGAVLERYILSEVLTRSNYNFEENSLNQFNVVYIGTPDNTALPRILSNNPHSGTYYLGGPLDTRKVSHVFTDLVIPEEHHEGIDAYNKAGNWSLFAKVIETFNQYYRLHVYADYFSESGILLYSDELLNPFAYEPRVGIWDPYKTEFVTLPIGTRSVRLNLKFTSTISNKSDMGIDDITFELYDAVQ